LIVDHPNISVSSPNVTDASRLSKSNSKRGRGRPPKTLKSQNYYGKIIKHEDDDDDDESDEYDDEPEEETLSELGQVIQQILSKINDFADTGAKNGDNFKTFEVFKEFDGQKSKKRKLSDFLAKNIDALMQLPTKVEISMQDFRDSTLGDKVRNKLDNLKTLKKAMELGLIFEEQFEEKQQQFLDSFSFSVPST